MARRTYEESIRRLQEMGFLKTDEHPPMPIHVPQPEDDGPLGLSFYRTHVEANADLSDLTIPRTFFGRSLISAASFRNTDLAESNLRWNDFLNVDFTEAVLERADCVRLCLHGSISPVLIYGMWTCGDQPSTAAYLIEQRRKVRSSLTRKRTN